MTPDLARVRTSIEQAAGIDAGELDEDAVEAAGSAGFVARGTLYCLIALITGSVFAGGIGGSGGDASSTGAIQALSRQPFGAVLLVALAVGLSGYALLRLLHVVTNPSDEDGLHGLVMRISYAVQSAIYGGLALFSLFQVFGGSGGGGGGEQKATRILLDLPGGVVIVAGVGVVFAGIAIAQARRAWTRDFMDHMPSSSGGSRHRTALVAGVAGHLARAVLFGMVAVLFVRAAIQHDASEAGGIDEALDAIASSPYGMVLLGFVTLGLAAYGAWCFSVAAWGRARHAE